LKAGIDKTLLLKLKKFNSKILDDLVHQMHDDAFVSFNCLECANCCKTIGPRLTVTDIDHLAKHLKMKVSVFMQKYVRKDEDNDYVFVTHQCPFLLSDNYCMVYERRPKACREYPHTNRNGVRQILDLSIKNCAVCPVVFEIFKSLKKEML
jgi:uncharacterized protein